MTFLQAQNFIGQWLPWATAAGVVWRVYHTGKASVTQWADKLLDNHLAHLQMALDEQTTLLKKIAEK